MTALPNLPSPAPAEATSLRHIPADSPAFRFDGRFDLTDAQAPVVIWQASRISVDFTGSELRVEFSDVKGQVFFDVTLDDATTRLDLREGQAPVGSAFTGLPAGPHRLTLFKRSEAAAGTAVFRGIAIARDARVVAPTPAGTSRRMLFLGDSITVGANNEDTAEDQWDDRATHNNARSHATLVAQAFHADWRNIAVSGMGICEGYVPYTARQIWDRVYPAPDAPRADLGTWIPDIVFINLGENDDSFTRSESRAFPRAFAAELVAFVRSVRTAWPRAQIVILRGGMFGGARSERLRGPWETAVAALEQCDPRLTHFAFTHWTEHHPRAADHRILADELIAWLRSQPFARIP